MVARSTARYLAPIALVLFTIVLIVVVASSGGGDGSSKPAPRPSAAAVRQAARRAAATPAKYTVQAGDSLLAIAQRTGVPTDQLQKLNPDIDPQVLVPGQRLKLRP
jgi:Tfp pilus assembly protein FimV